MSQNDSTFQSKGKKFGGGGKPRGKPGGGGFKKRFEGDKGGYKGGGGKRFDREGGSERKFEGRGGKPSFEKRDSEKSGGFEGGKPYKKREWQDRGPPRGDSRREDRGDSRRDDRGAGGERKFEGRGGKPAFRDRDGGGGSGGGKPYQKREWKPREDRAPRKDDSGSDGGYHKREWKPREDRPQGEGRAEGGGEKKREWKPREDRPQGEGRSEGGGYKKREWQDRGPPRGDNKDFRGKRNFGDNKSFGQKKGFRDTFDKRPRRARDFDLDEDIQAEEIPVATNSAETRNKLKSDRPGYGSPSSAFLYGVHAVSAALKNPKRLHQRLMVTTNGFEAIREAYEAAIGEGLKLPQPIYVEGVDIERLLPRDAVHQGLLLDCQPLEDLLLADILLTAGDNAKILVLDQVTDPHNVGAILRSAAAFGAVAVVVQKLHAPDITGTLAKSASGAVEHVQIAREVNLTRALEQLKEAGYFCIGLAEEGKATLAELHSSGKVALVLGAEGDGLRRLVSETCDVLAKLPTGGPIASLNVSNAAAVALYELIRKA